jgi:ABC-type lipoprotein export system ATPase subunit
MSTPWHRQPPAADTDIDTAVELTEVTKRYPARELPALDRVSLTIRAGDFAVLMGPSGSGKSTLLNLIGALDRPTEGEIRVHDRNLSTGRERELTRIRRDVCGFVFQQFHLIPSLTALENVITPLVPVRRPGDRVRRAREALDAVGLADKPSQLPGQLSGGEQQRVAIARALVMQPRLLLADEPTGNLDVHTGETILGLLDQLQRERGMTLVLATHDPEVALRAHRVFGLVDGRLAADITITSQTDTHTLYDALGYHAR